MTKDDESRELREHELLEETRARLAAIVESSEDAILSKSLDGTIRSWNAGAQRVFGYTAEEAIGRHITLVIPPERIEEERYIIDRLQRGERIDHFETVRVTKDGRFIDISLTVSPLRDSLGRVVGASKIARDITAQKRVSRELEVAATRLSLAIGAARLGDWHWDARSDVVQLSARAAEIFGLPEEPITWASLRGLLHEEDRDPTLAVFDQALRERSAYEVEYRISSGGRERWVSAMGRVQCHDNGQVSAMIGMVQDITERKNLEAELRRRAEELAESDTKKNDFIALLAHELRTPLAPVRTGLQILRRSSGNQDLWSETGTVMERQLSQMVRLIDDLLDVSRLNHNRLELQKAPISLQDAVDHALDSVREAISAARHDFELRLPTEPLLLDADLARLAQVLSNLLTNSVKYTPAGGRISLSAERLQNEVVISVEDTGIGIAQEALPRVFEMFAQLDRSMTRSGGGLGIGLALVKGLVEGHGGRVSANSPGLGLGSTFRVHLPLLAGKLPEPARSVATPKVAQRRRVLVVDDSHDGAETMATLLEMMGQEVHLAHDGEDAVAVAERVRPHIVLMDVGMPRMSGLEATRTIRQKPWGHELRIYALTGWGQERDREQSRAAGCDGHLVKPIDHVALRRLLEEADSSVLLRPSDAGR